MLSGLKRKVLGARSTSTAEWKTKDEYQQMLTVTSQNLDKLFQDCETALINNPAFKAESEGVAHCMALSEELETNDDVRLYLPCHAMLYYLTRLIKPEVIVETGVERGGSTFAFLRAMEINEKHHGIKGELYSFDKTSFVHTEWGAGLAPVVPRDLVKKFQNEKRWHHYEGMSMDRLPSILRDKMLVVDLASVMSDHGYENQSAETREIWPHLRPRGYIVIDRPDIEGNNFRAWNSFQLDFRPVWSLLLKESKKSLPFMFGVMQK